MCKPIGCLGPDAATSGPNGKGYACNWCDRALVAAQHAVWVLPYPYSDAMSLEHMQMWPLLMFEPAGCMGPDAATRGPNGKGYACNWCD